MKLLITIFLFTVNLTLAQVPGATFFGKDVMKYKGVNLKVVSTPELYLFFMLDKNRPWNAPDNTYLPGSPSLSSDPGQIFGKEFYVNEVSKHPFDDGNYILELKEKASGQILYYYYDPSAANSFAMRVVGNSVTEQDYEEPAIDYCSRIEVKRDKFTGETTYKSPYSRTYNLMVYKDAYKSKPPVYTLALFTTGSTPSAYARGLTILLDNKQKIRRPQADVDVEVREYDTHGREDYEYSAYIKLTPAERLLLQNHRITDFRLYIYDEEIIESEGSRIQEYLKCLLNRK